MVVHWRNSRSLLANILTRETTRAPVLDRPWLQELAAGSDGPGHIIHCEPRGRPSLPFICAYSNVMQRRRLLAIADESGCVTCMRTDLSMPHSSDPDVGASDHSFKRWAAHENTIYDMDWSLSDDFIATASGDRSVRVWDTESENMVASLAGHTCSVKSAKFLANSNLLVSGSRDGCVRVFDQRSDVRALLDSVYVSHTPVLTIAGAHRDTSLTKLKPRGKESFSQGVTSVLVLNNGTTIASGGATDGCVKLWDMRMASQTVGTLAVPIPSELPRAVAATNPIAYEELQSGIGVYHGDPGEAELPGMSAGLMGEAYPSQFPLPPYAQFHAASRRSGVVSLTQPQRGSQLLVTTHEGSHWLLESNAPEGGPLAVFRGPLGRRSFTTAAAFSPDGSHVVAGSTDSNAYIWQVSKPAAPPYVLRGHSLEVTSVAWCPVDEAEVATCSDDGTIRVWKLNRSCHPRLRVLNPIPVMPYNANGDVANFEVETPGLITPEAVERQRTLHTPPTAIAAAGSGSGALAAALAAVEERPSSAAKQRQRPITEFLRPPEKRIRSEPLGFRQPPQQAVAQAETTAARRKRSISGSSSSGGLPVQRLPRLRVSDAVRRLSMHSVSSQQEVVAKQQGIGRAGQQQLHQLAAADSDSCGGSTRGNRPPTACGAARKTAVAAGLAASRQLQATITSAGALEEDPIESSVSEQQHEVLTLDQRQRAPAAERRSEGCAAELGLASSRKLSDSSGNGNGGFLNRFYGAELQGNEEAGHVVGPTPPVLECHEWSDSENSLDAHRGPQTAEYADTQSSRGPHPSKAARAFSALLRSSQRQATLQQAPTQREPPRAENQGNGDSQPVAAIRFARLVYCGEESMGEFNPVGNPQTVNADVLQLRGFSTQNLQRQEEALQPLQEEGGAQEDIEEMEVGEDEDDEPMPQQIDDMAGVSEGFEVWAPGQAAVADTPAADAADEAAWDFEGRSFPNNESSNDENDAAAAAVINGAVSQVQPVNHVMPAVLRRFGQPLSILCSPPAATSAESPDAEATSPTLDSLWQAADGTESVGGRAEQNAHPQSTVFRELFPQAGGQTDSQTGGQTAGQIASQPGGLPQIDEDAPLASKPTAHRPPTRVAADATKLPLESLSFGSPPRNTSHNGRLSN